MENAKISWEKLCLRRRIDKQTWLKNKNITSYDLLVKWCLSNNVEAPDKKSVSEFFQKPKKTKKKSLLKVISSLKTEENSNQELDMYNIPELSEKE